MKHAPWMDPTRSAPRPAQALHVGPRGAIGISVPGMLALTMAVGLGACGGFDISPSDVRVRLEVASAGRPLAWSGDVAGQVVPVRGATPIVGPIAHVSGTTPAVIEGIVHVPKEFCEHSQCSQKGITAVVRTTANVPVTVCLTPFLTHHERECVTGTGSVLLTVET